MKLQKKKRNFLEHQEGRKTWKTKIWVNSISVPSPFEFSKLCLMVEAKIITLSDVVLNVHGGDIKDNYTKYGEGKGT